MVLLLLLLVAVVRRGVRVVRDLRIRVVGMMLRLLLSMVMVGRMHGRRLGL